MLTKLTFQPGINRDTTSYTNSGGWFDSDFVRFRNGLPEKIGGWTRIYANQTPLIGKCRKLFSWSSLVGNEYLACPTNIKFYVDNSSGVIDITPIRRSVPLGTDPIATSNGSSNVTITDVNHGANVGDYVAISGASNTNGILATDLNKEFVIQSVANANAYAVTTAGTATSTGSGGGSNVSAQYEFHPGTSGSVAFTGWGSGPWGGPYGWGFGPTTVINSYYGGLWTVDNYGEDMIACPRDVTNFYELGTSPLSVTNGSNVVTVTQVNHGFSNGTAVIVGGVNNAIGGIPTLELNGTHLVSVVNANAYTYTVTTAASSDTTGGTDANAFTSSIVYWDIDNLNGPAVSLSNLGSAYSKKYLPYVATEVLVSDQNRQVIAFGCNPYDVTQGQDKMVIRWSDSKDPTNWDAADTTTTSGENRLSSGSFIVTAVQNREEILVWTDTALYSMTYVGPPYGYGFNYVGSSFDIIGPNAKIVAGSAAFWMGSNNFYSYAGKIEPLPCTVRDYVFLDLDTSNGDKVYCSADSGNNEIIWFYPSKSQSTTGGVLPGDVDVDRYVVYNYQDNAWYYGTLARTAWIDRVGNNTPRAVSVDGYLYQHEVGFNDGSTSPASPINAYIQSSPVEISDGDRFMFVNRVIPDLTFRNSTTANGGTEPTVKFTIKPQDYPGGAIGIGDERNAQRNSASTLKVDRFTDQMFTRVRARSVALKVESNELNVSWRLGTPRIDMREDGRR